VRRAVHHPPDTKLRKKYYSPKLPWVRTLLEFLATNTLHPRTNPFTRPGNVEPKRANRDLARFV
jgi:hypothetical protein